MSLNEFIVENGAPTWFVLFFLSFVSMAGELI